VLLQNAPGVGLPI